LPGGHILSDCRAFFIFFEKQIGNIGPATESADMKFIHHVFPLLQRRFIKPEV